MKAAAAARANAPVRKCGVKYQVSWREQNINRAWRGPYTTQKAGFGDMRIGSLKHAARLATGAGALAVVLGLSGCSGNPVSTFTTPTLSEIERQTVESTVSDDALITPGTLTVALDTNDAPQAIKDSDGKLTGYVVDTARAIACRMGLKVAFVDAASPDSALNGKKADIYIGDVSRVGSGVSSLGDCLYDAPSVFGKAGDGKGEEVSLDKLNSSTLGVQSASASQESLTKSGITGTQKTYSNINECFQALDSGEVDYVVCDSTAGGYLARLDDKVTYLGALQTPTTLGVASLDSNATLAKAVSEALDNITADGTLDAVHSVWYGTMPYDLTTKTVSGTTVEKPDTTSSSEVASTTGDSSSDEESASASSTSTGSTAETKTITDNDINKLAD